MMSSPIYLSPSAAASDVIKVAGICYRYDGPSEIEPTVVEGDLEGEYANCELCAVSKSSSSSSAETLPGNCDNFDDRCNGIADITIRVTGSADIAGDHTFSCYIGTEGEILPQCWRICLNDGYGPLLFLLCWCEGLGEEGDPYRVRLEFQFHVGNYSDSNCTVSTISDRIDRWQLVYEGTACPSSVTGEMTCVNNGASGFGWVTIDSIEVI